MAGYSGTPLAKKLGIGEGARLLPVTAPDEFLPLLEPMPADVKVLRRAAAPIDVAVVFATRHAELRRGFRRAVRALVADGGLWLAWPKKASGVATDIDFDVAQRTGLDGGLVDNKVCAIDETWSALRFVVRKRARATWKVQRA